MGMSIRMRRNEAKLRIGIIDADLLSRKKHRFPNLACMKISGYYKEQGCDVSLLRSYNEIENYDKVFVSKVFTDTPVPDGVLDLPEVEYGGTGFFFDKAPNLPDEIEHHFPDYHLYDDFVNAQIEAAVSWCETEDDEITARKKPETSSRSFWITASALRQGDASENAVSA